jgi:hypothetical protein
MSVANRTSGVETRRVPAAAGLELLEAISSTKVLRGVPQGVSFGVEGFENNDGEEVQGRHESAATIVFHLPTSDC